MKKLYILSIVILATISTGATLLHVTRQFTPIILLDEWPYKSKTAVVITCDDVSSGYSLEYHEEIVSIIEKYDLRCTFFVIPYHGAWDLLTDSEEHMNLLHEAVYSGHEIALHGYTHYKNEFVCSPEKQKEYLKKGLDIMEEAGFTVKGFRAPCLQITPETLDILKEYNFVYDSSCFGMSKIYWDGPVPQISTGHEYTWYLQPEDLEKELKTAKKDFDRAYNSNGLFSMVIHVKAVNEGEGINFLDQFFSYIKGKAWNFTLIELVEWKQSVKEVTWETKKTLTGGEITFYNVPEGLTMEVVLPDEYNISFVPGVTVSKEVTGDKHFEIVFDQKFSQITLVFKLKYASEIQ
jgi:predicted deacetylase